MAVLSASQFPMLEVTPGVRARRIVDQPQGSGAVTVSEGEVAPGVGMDQLLDELRG